MALIWVGSPPPRTGIGSSLGELCALILSHAETNHGAPPKPRTNEEHNDISSLTPESGRETMTRRLAENLDPETFRQILSMGGPAGYGAIRPGDLPPANIFMSSPSFSDSSGTSTPLGLSKPGGLDTTNRIKEVSRGTNAAHAVGGTSPILPMELMTYNGLMTDIGGTASARCMTTSSVRYLSMRREPDGGFRGWVITLYIS